MTATGIQVRLGVDATRACPVAAVTDGDSGRVTNVDWTTQDDTVVEEFEIDDGEINAEAAEDMEIVFEANDRKRVRFTRSITERCICDCIESHGCPVTELDAEDGELSLSFYGEDMVTVRTVLRDVQDRFEGVSVQRLSRTGETEESDLALVDRDELTDRQREVLETALEMGYFSRPREANATEVAATLDISPSTFAEHLAAAESKMFGSLFDG